jgi:hypothetical protein
MTTQQFPDDGRRFQLLGIGRREGESAFLNPVSRWNAHLHVCVSLPGEKEWRDLLPGESALVRTGGGEVWKLVCLPDSAPT